MTIHSQNEAYDVTEIISREFKAPEVISLPGNTLGIVGTSFKGPAFVPQNIKTYEAHDTIYNTFENIFGEISKVDKIYESQISAYDWFSQGGEQVSFVRVLGIGDNGIENEEGIVENSGFIVGENVVSGSITHGNLNSNSFSSGDYKGKVHFICNQYSNNQFVSDPLVDRLSSSNDYLQQIGYSDETTHGNLITTTAFTPSGSMLVLQSSADFDVTNFRKEDLFFERELVSNVTSLKFPHIIVKDLNEEERSIINDYKNPEYLYKKSQFSEQRFNHYSKYTLHKGHLNYANYFFDQAFKRPDDSKIFILKSNENTSVYEDFTSPYKTAKTPWIVSQPLNRSGIENNRINLYDKCQKLFRFVALDDGEVGNNYRIRITPQRLGDAKKNAWSKFSVFIWKYNELKNIFEELASFIGLDLNPQSPDYIARVIGTSYEFFNHKTKKIEEKGEYKTRNNFLRVEINSEIEYSTNISQYKLMPSGFMPYPKINTTGLLFEGEPVIQNPIPYIFNLLRNRILTSELQPDSLYWGVSFDYTIHKNTTATINNKEYIYKVFAKTSYRNDYVRPFINYSKYYQDNFNVKDKNNWIYDLEDNNTDATNSFFHLEKILHTNDDDFSSTNHWKNAMYRRDGVDPNSIDSLGTASDSFKYLNIDDVLYEEGNSNSIHSKYLSFDFFTYGGFDGVNILDSDKKRQNQSAFIREIEDEENIFKYNGPTTYAYQIGHDLITDLANSDIDCLCFPQIGHNKFNKQVSDTANSNNRYITLLNVPEFDETGIVKDYNFYEIDLNQEHESREKQTISENIPILSNGIDLAIADTKSYYYNNKFTLNFANTISSVINFENISDNMFVGMPVMPIIKSIAKSFKPIDSINTFRSNKINYLNIFNTTFSSELNNDYVRIINNSNRSQSNVNFIVNKKLTSARQEILPNSANTCINNRNSLNRLGHNTRIMLDIKKKIKYNLLTRNIMFEPNSSIDNKYVALYNILNTTLLEYKSNNIIYDYYVSLNLGLDSLSKQNKLNNLITSKVGISLFGKKDEVLEEFSLADVLNAIQNNLTQTNNQSIINIDV